MRQQDNLLQYNCLENPMDREAWQAAVHRLAQSWTRLKRQHAQEAHNRILAVWELENAWKTFKIIEGLFVKWTGQKVSIHNYGKVFLSPIPDHLEEILCFRL